MTKLIAALRLRQEEKAGAREEEVIILVCSILPSLCFFTKTQKAIAALETMIGVMVIFASSCKIFSFD